MYSIGSLVYAEEMVVVSSVNRRLNGDLYWISGVQYHCGDNKTLLVDERQCMNDHDLINSKNFNACCLSLIEILTTYMQDAHSWWFLVDLTHLKGSL